MTNLRVFNNPYAFVDEETPRDEGIDPSHYAEFNQRCTDLIATLENTRAYFESLQSLSPEELASLCQDSLESDKTLHTIGGYASDLIKQMSYMHGVLTR